MDTYEFLEQLIAIDSPTGFTRAACDFVFKQLEELGLRPERTRKGAVRCGLGPDPRLALAAHIDTLGAVVSEIRADGTLRISAVGGLSLNMAEGEYVRIHTLDGSTRTGTFLLDNPSAHVNRELSTKPRDPGGMHIRLDENLTNADDARALGIRVGDVVAFDTRYQSLPSGHLKSRFLDNKAGCAVLYAVAKELASSATPVELYFSNYEEVGHGGATGYSPGIEELLVLDMGVHGAGCEGRETACSICAKDSSGPYDYEMRRRLILLAEAGEIEHVVDVYPYYSSDGSAAWRAGNDVRVGLIGPGVAASHGVERTHRRGVDASIALSLAYISQHARA